MVIMADGEGCDELCLGITPAVIHLGLGRRLLAIVEERPAKLFPFCLCSVQRFLALCSRFGYCFVEVGHVLGIFHEGVAATCIFCDILHRIVIDSISVLCYTNGVEVNRCVPSGQL